MKNFFIENEPYFPGMSGKDYKEGKRKKVLEVIKPIMEAFEIEDYDYICTESRERLCIEGTEIMCGMNSIGATVNMLIGYLFLNYYMENHTFGKIGRCNVDAVIENTLTQYYVKENKDV